MKKHVKIILTLIPLISICLLIFLMSAEKGSDSDATSGAVVSFLPQALLDFVGNTFGLEDEVVSLFVEKYLRILAHFCEFALLGALSFLHFSTWCGKYRTLVSCLFTVIYAISDEVHQYFVPGRTAQIGDIITDASGGLAGIVFALVVCYFYFFVQKKKTDKVKSICS